jgi:GH15 family glucan-1,4-alpha-glucosidase
LFSSPNASVDPRPGSITAREEGYLPLESYGALGDGRTIALSGADGSIDWWCVPNLDSPPLFDRILDAEQGGRFVVAPDVPFTVERCYREGSNVLETVFTTGTGRAKLVESINSGTAGRLPWAELARRIDGLDGHVTFRIEMTPGRRANRASPYHSRIGSHSVFHVGALQGLLLYGDGVLVEQNDEGIVGHCTVGPGERRVVAIIAGQNEPLVVPPIEKIDRRIDLSDAEWRQWSDRVEHGGEWHDAFVRSALVLKLLLFAPSGAIAAAGTTSLPEGVGGVKNYDYCYAWVRGAGYVITAFLAAGREPEAKAALTWLLNRLKQHGSQVCFTLDGGLVPAVEEVDVPGYRNSRPVVTGNAASGQHQHGVFGDIFETAARFVANGNMLDPDSSELLSHIADQCADMWRMKDAGMWELPEPQHYTMSKISCWQALSRAVELADQGQIPTTCRDRWARERNRVAEWIGTHCWSEDRGAYIFYPGSDALDASIALAVRFGFDGHDKLRSTLDAIDRELGAGPYHYRYSGEDKEEACFLACSFWMVEARALLGQRDLAREKLTALMRGLDRGVGVWTEMVDPKSGMFLGNLPQGLTHLAHIMALDALAGVQDRH